MSKQPRYQTLEEVDAARAKVKVMSEEDKLKTFKEVFKDFNAKEREFGNE